MGKKKLLHLKKSLFFNLGFVPSEMLGVRSACLKGSLSNTTWPRSILKQTKLVLHVPEFVNATLKLSPLFLLICFMVENQEEGNEHQPKWIQTNNQPQFNSVVVSKIKINLCVWWNVDITQGIPQEIIQKTNSTIDYHKGRGAIEERWTAKKWCLQRQISQMF